MRRCVGSVAAGSRRHHRGSARHAGAPTLHPLCFPLSSLLPHLQYKVWVKPSSEMGFLYGNHVLKSGIGRMTEGIPQYAGCVVLSMTNVPLGFGRAAHTTEAAKDLDPTSIVVLHQADIGEFLRSEDNMAT